MEQKCLKNTIETKSNFIKDTQYCNFFYIDSKSVGKETNTRNGHAFYTRESKH